MQRNLYPQLLAWKNSANRKPLVLRGARQVGKTHLLTTFAKQEYPEHVYLNFEETPRLADLFRDNLDPQTILKNISTYIGKDIKPNLTLIIFDEIQEAPNALNSLKYFCESAKEFHIVAAGSLLGVKLARNKGFPVGKVNFLDLYPLSFMEFLQAIGKNHLHQFLNDVKNITPIPEPIHDELINLLKKYFYVGGMPEAVVEYINTQDLTSIRKIHKEILDAYVLDFAKHAPTEQIMKITEVWRAIPNQLAKENKKFIFSAIRKSARARDYETALQWLEDAGLIYKSHNISTPKLPLSGYHDKNFFKVFMLDVGLLAAMCNISAKLILENHSLFSEFNGAFTENFIAQAIVTSLNQPLYYWTSPGNAEVDFIIEHNAQVYPLEVKSGTSTKQKSLLVYKKKYQPQIVLRASLLNLKKDNDVVNLPLYFDLTRIICDDVCVY